MGKQGGAAEIHPKMQDRQQPWRTKVFVFQ